jgi:hypothetical protein
MIPANRPGLAIGWQPTSTDRSPDHEVVVNFDLGQDDTMPSHRGRGGPLLRHHNAGLGARVRRRPYGASQKTSISVPSGSQQRNVT